jgi:hypothetical protein
MVSGQSLHARTWQGLFVLLLQGVVEAVSLNYLLCLRHQLNFLAGSDAAYGNGNLIVHVQPHWVEYA